MRVDRQRCLPRSTGIKPVRDQSRIAVAPKAFGAVCSGLLSAAHRRDELSHFSVATARRGTMHTKARRTHAFTLAELLVTTGVLVLLVFLASHLLNSTATVTTLGHKRMDADSQARQLLDRMGVDFAQMVKRSDVDYYVKSNPPSGGFGLRTALQPGNDRIAFYSGVPGYFPASNHKSPVSVVAYRVNSGSKMERMGKGLLWNGAPSPSPTPTATPPPGTPTPTATLPPGTPTPTPTQPIIFTPTVFIPVPLASPLPATELPAPTPDPLPTPAWPEASSATIGWSDSEVIGPQVFRFEYYYLLKNGSFSEYPMISPHTSLSGMQDVSAIVVDIAVIDPKSKVLLGPTVAAQDAQLATLASGLSDYIPATMSAPGRLRANWQNTLDTNTTLPRPAISGIRLYERFFYLSAPVL